MNNKKITHSTSDLTFSSEVDPFTLASSMKGCCKFVQIFLGYLISSSDGMETLRNVSTRALSQVYYRSIKNNFTAVLSSRPNLVGKKASKVQSCDELKDS